MVKTRQLDVSIYISFFNTRKIKAGPANNVMFELKLTKWI